MVHGPHAPPTLDVAAAHEPGWTAALHLFSLTAHETQPRLASCLLHKHSSWRDLARNVRGFATSYPCGPRRRFTRQTLRHRTAFKPSGRIATEGAQHVERVPPVAGARELLRLYDQWISLRAVSRRPGQRTGLCA